MDEYFAKRDEHFKKIKEHIIRVPRMYIGHEWDTDGLHILVVEIIKLAVQPESLNEASSLIVIIEQTGDILIKDDGRGLPVEPIRIGQSMELPPIEHVLTGYMPNRPDYDYYHEFGFLNYLGTVLNAVSKHLRIETVRDGELYRLWCIRGKLIEPLHRVTNPIQSKKGTCITFLPDPDVFSEPGLDSQRLIESLSHLATEYPQVTFKFYDKRTDDGMEF